VRLLLDEHLGSHLAEQLRLRGHDVVGVHERIDLRGASDEVLVAVAIKEDRAIVTRNIRDFVRIHNDRIGHGDHHTGVLLVQRRKFPEGRGAVGRLVIALHERLCSGLDLTDTYEYL
jgi:uncharacterized protein with PIN domain